jgi:heptosyltransferase II
MADQPLDLGTTKACIRRGRMMVSTDSGPRHVAAALGVPVITFYGPTPPIWSANPSQRAIDLRLELDCIGCRKRTCPLVHNRCMRELSVDMAFASVEKMLESCSPSARTYDVSGSESSESQTLRAQPHFPIFSDDTNMFGSSRETLAPY